MKKYLYALMILLLGTVAGCTSKDPVFTTYTGVVVEQNSLNPIPNLHVVLTDGAHNYSESVTNSMGRFSMEVSRNSIQGGLYIFIDGNGVYPSKKIDLIYTDEGNYDYGMIFLFNQTDASLYPTIEHVAWDYPNGDHSMRFKDIVIKSDYSLTEAYVEISKDEGFVQSEKYQLEKLGNGKYEVVVDGLIVGEQYYFQVVASNTVGTGKSEVFSRVFGLPKPLIIELKSATVNSATIEMIVSEEPLSTLSAGLCWSTSHNPSVNDNIQPGLAVGTSDVTITGINFNTTTYYVRAYAQNANGFAYSEEMVLPANNPYSLPTFTSGGYTYTYKYLGRGSWYTAYNACTSLVCVFDDWTLPDIYVIADLFNTYYAENGEIPPLPIWSRRRDLDWEIGESETFMVTSNGNIMASKNLLADYYAVRRL